VGKKKCSWNLGMEITLKAVNGNLRRRYEDNIKLDVVEV
jgi:hypothetical protein